jgi:hypothetical protein
LPPAEARNRHEKVLSIPSGSVWWLLGRVLNADLQLDALKLVVSGFLWAHVPQGSLPRELVCEESSSRGDRLAAYPPTNGRGGGKQPMGKGVSRCPARSFSAALRYASTNRK